MLKLNSILRACIVLAGHACSLYVYTTIAVSPTWSWANSANLLAINKAHLKDLAKVKKSLFPTLFFPNLKNKMMWIKISSNFSEK